LGVAVATVTLPAVSKIAAGGDMAHFRETLAKAIRLALFLTLPATIGLVMMSNEIIGLIYERGKFTAEDTVQTGAALKFYAVGLMGYACIKVLSPAFYALERKWTPMLVTFFGIALNIFLNWQLTFRMGLGHKGLALSTGLVATIDFFILYFLMRRAAGGMETFKVVGSFGRILVAAAGLAAVCLYGKQWLAPWLVAPALADRAWSLLAIIAAGASVYFFLCAVLRVDEAREALSLVKRKITRRAIAPPGA
jgi:putative peptidoglycan lipid II flippase